MKLNNIQISIICIILACFMYQTVFAIKCWECRSDADGKCGDPFDNTSLAITNCEHASAIETLPGVRATMCRKIRQKVNGEWRYFRNCAYMGEPGLKGDERFCIMRTGSYNIFIEYCTCNSKDGCNSAPTAYPKSIIFLTPMFVLFCKYIFKILN